MALTFPKHPELEREVSAWLATHEVRPTTFGKQAVGDPSLISTLQAGRELRSDTLRRIRLFMLVGSKSSNRKSA